MENTGYKFLTVTDSPFREWKLAKVPTFKLTISEGFFEK